MRRIFYVIVFILVSFLAHQTLFAEVNISLGLFYSGKPSGNIQENMGTIKNPIGAFTIIGDFDVEEKIVLFPYLSFFKLNGNNSTLENIPQGPHAGYGWKTSLKMYTMNINIGIILLRSLIPNIGIGYYYGEKSFERMEEYPYYWEKAKEKGNAFGLNGGILSAILISEKIGIFIFGNYQQVFHKTIGGGFWNVGIALDLIL